MRASSEKRRRMSSSWAQFSASTLTATVASSASSVAIHTVANAPVPSMRSTRYRPMCSSTLAPRPWRLSLDPHAIPGLTWQPR